MSDCCALSNSHGLVYEQSYKCIVQTTRKSGRMSDRRALLSRLSPLLGVKLSCIATSAGSTGSFSILSSTVCTGVLRPIVLVRGKSRVCAGCDCGSFFVTLTRTLVGSLDEFTWQCVQARLCISNFLNQAS